MKSWLPTVLASHGRVCNARSCFYRVNRVHHEISRSNLYYVGQHARTVLRSDMTAICSSISEEGCEYLRTSRLRRASSSEQTATPSAQSPSRGSISETNLLPDTIDHSFGDDHSFARELSRVEDLSRLGR